MFKFSLLREVKATHQPTRRQIDQWLRHSLQQRYANVSLSVTIVDNETSQQLNREYRHIDKPTNVISLEYPDARVKFNLLSGELILCDEVICHEAQRQNKLVLAHYAHLLIHGMLHLQGYDHQQESEAQIMESLETELMLTLGFKNPYQED